MTLQRATALEKMYKCEIDDKEDIKLNQTQLKILIFNLCREIKQIFVSIAGSEEENKIQQFIEEQKTILKNKYATISTLNGELGQIRDEELANSLFQPQNLSNQRMFGQGHFLTILQSTKLINFN